MKTKINSYRFLSVVLSFLCAVVAFPADLKAAPSNEPISLIVNGETVETDAPPVIVDGRTLVPARALVDSLDGYIVEWDPDAQIVYILNSITDVVIMELEINSTEAEVFAFVNGMPSTETVSMDVPAQIINGRTMIPARFVAEHLHCQVSWDASARAVVVTDTQ